MGKHLRRAFTTLAPLGAVVAVVAYLLTHDIPTVLGQADRSATQIARALGIAAPPEQMATYMWSHPYLAFIVGVLLLALGAGVSWLIETAYSRWKNRVRQIAPAPEFNMPLQAVLEHVALKSEWSVTRDWDSPGDQWQKTMWQKPLGREFLRPLASGEILARGVKSTKEGDEHGHSDIPVSYWLNPKLDFDAARLLCEPGFDHVFDFDGGVMYHDICLPKAAVDEMWPARDARQIKKRPSPFVAWADEWKAEFNDRLIDSQVEYEKLRGQAVAEFMAETKTARLARKGGGDEQDA